MREGSAEAHLLYGIELAKGSFGPKDLEQALRHYRKALELTETGVQVSDPDALYVRAHQLHGGYGVPVQRDAARNAAARAAEQLTSWRANELAQAAAWGWAPFERREPDIATTLLDKGLLSRDPKTYILGLSSCRGLSDEMRAGVDSAYQRCSKHWYRKGAEAGAVSAMGSHAENLLRAGEDLTLALRYLRQGHTENTPDQRLLEPLVAYMVGKGDPRMLLDEAWVVLGQNRNAGSEFVAASLWDTAGTVVLLAPFTEARLSPESLRTLGQMLRMLADRAGTSANTRRAISDFGGGAAPALLAGFDSAAQRRAAITQVPPAVVQAPARDREQQDKTGYVPGEPRAAAGGLSVFTVDNAQGSGDAIARLYLEGRKPAVRSFFVKHGEKFTASGLRAGSYVMRYRYMGSEDTYEADRVFALTEEKTDRGTRYSRITVTLYKVTDGNLQTKKVPPEQF
jgi:TPR repeat protein